MTVLERNHGSYYCNKCSTSNSRKRKLQNGFSHKKIDVFKRYCDEKGYTPISAESDYVNCYSKMEYICPIHGKQQIAYINMQQGQGCKYCGYQKMKDKQKLPWQYIKEYIQSQNGNILLNAQEYKNQITNNLRIICGECGKEYTTSFAYYKDSLRVCKQCAFKIRKNAKKYSPDDVLQICNQLGVEILNPYEYINNREKNMMIKCSSCGKAYLTSLQAITTGYTRCSHCHIKSKGEEKIQSFLNNNNISFIKQQRFDDCRNINPLPFDFYLVDYNILIQYDGEQHYWPVFGEQQFKQTQTNDKIKDEYCRQKQIQLIRIPFYQIDIIEDILSVALNI